MSESNDKVTNRPAMPQRIGPAATPQKQRKPRGRTFRRFLKLLIVVLVLVAIALGGVLAYDKMRGPTDDDRITEAITDYMTAVHRGDLPALQADTCGPAHAYYASLDATQFAAIYNASRESAPIIDEVKRVEITGDRALAEVSAHTNAHAEKTVRTVGLQRVGGTWKVCDKPE